MSEKKTTSRVTIDLSYYNSIRDKAKSADVLKEEIEALKKKHQDEIHQLKEEGKIAVMVETPFGRLFGGKPHVLEVVGLDKVRPQFEEAIINEEVGKANEKLIKELAESKTKVSDLEAEIERLKGRSLWERITNKF